MRKLILSLAAFTGSLALAPSASADECMAGPWMVFFDAGSAELSEPARAILANAAAAYLQCGAAPINIAGHTDRVGTEAANMRLSARIAEQVRTYLLARGIPADRIHIKSFGESRPLVETEDGGSEPQNRRAEIVFGNYTGW